MKKEHSLNHKHKCGCITNIKTFGYKPKKPDIQDVCPKCTLKELEK